MNVSDRRLHVQLTQEAEIASDFSLLRAIFAFAGFVSALRVCPRANPFEYYLASCGQSQTALSLAKSRAGKQLAAPPAHNDSILQGCIGSKANP